MDFVKDLTRAEIAELKEITAPGLWFDYEGEKRTPLGLYFGCDLRLFHDNPNEYEGRLYTHFDNSLRPVYDQNGKQFEVRGLANVNAIYKNGIISGFYKQ